MAHVDGTRPALLRNFLQRRASSSPRQSSDIASDTVFATKGSAASSTGSPVYDPAFEVVDRVIASKAGHAADGTRYGVERGIFYTNRIASPARRCTWSSGSTSGTRNVPGKLPRRCRAVRTRSTSPVSTRLTRCQRRSRRARPTQQRCLRLTTAGSCATTRWRACAGWCTAGASVKTRCLLTRCGLSRKNICSLVGGWTLHRME